MTHRVVVVDHYDSYTWNLVHLVASVTGALPRVVEHDESFDWGDATHVVLSPGPGHPASVTDFALGPAVLGLGLPVLGVCLGMQALVHHLGGTVERVDPAHGEVARVEHDGAGVFAGLPQGLAAVRYHSLAARELPPELVPTATTPGADGPVLMGVRHRNLPLEGVQFHPESVLSEHGRRMVANFLERR